MRTICLGGEEQLVYITVKRRCGRCSAAVLLFGIIYKNSSGIAVFRRSQNNFRQKKKVGNSIRITYLLWRRERDSNPCPACTGYRISSADPSTTWVSLQLLCYYNQSDGKNQGLPKDILLSASLALFAAFRLILRLPNAPRSYRHPLHQRSG